MICDLQGHTAAIYAVRFLTDTGSEMLSCGADRQVTH